MGIPTTAMLLLLVVVEVIGMMGMASASYRVGDLVPMSRMGQYHAMRTNWHDILGHHCPIFGVNREVLFPIPKPTGYTGADAYKISFLVGREKFLIPWLLVINRKSSEIPMIDIHLRFSGSDIHGVTAKVVNMPRQYVDSHEDLLKEFWDPEHWPKRILVRYFCVSTLCIWYKFADSPSTRYVLMIQIHLNNNCRQLAWEETSEIDVSGGFYVLFGAGFLLTVVMSIYILQSSQEKIVRFVRENVVESSLPMEEAKVE